MFPSIADHTPERGLRRFSIKKRPHTTDDSFDPYLYRNFSAGGRRAEEADIAVESGHTGLDDRFPQRSSHHLGGQHSLSD